MSDPTGTVIQLTVELFERLSEEDRAYVSAALVAQLEDFSIKTLSCTIDGETGSWSRSEVEDE